MMLVFIGCIVLVLVLVGCDLVDAVFGYADEDDDALSGAPDRLDRVG